MNKIIKLVFFASLSILLVATNILPGILNPSPNSKNSVWAEPAKDGEERGIWINRYEIVLYNNVFVDEEDTSLDIPGMPEIRNPKGGELFQNDDALDISGATQNFEMGASEGLDIGDSYTNPQGCANLVVTSRSRARLTANCPGRRVPVVNTDVILERPELAEVEGYLNGDTATLGLYLENIFDIPAPRNLGDGAAVNGKVIFTGDGWDNPEFIKTDGQGGNNGGNQAMFSDCDGTKCYGKNGEGKPGDQNNSWVVVEESGNNPNLYSVRREDTGFASGTCSGGDCSATIVIKFKGIKDRSYDRETMVDQAAAFRERKTKEIAYTIFFQADNNRQLGIAQFACGGKLESPLTPSLSYIIDTLSKPIPGPFYECLQDGFSDNATFAAIDSIEGKAADQPDYLIPVDEDVCSSEDGIPIITDLACGLTLWIYDTLFEVFTGVINYFSSPPSMFEDQTGTLSESIKNLRNIANLIFVVAFLMVVLQYMTNINVVDAYFIKKFIPRLVIAVILVQASFFIVSELNYFFFDLGQSVQTIVFSGQEPGNLTVGDGFATIATFSGPALIGIALTIGIVMLVVLLITVIILTLRYILLIVLAILAPLAFAAIAIPQLEGVSKKWFMMYIKLLLMYPIIMFFIAASSIIGQVFSGGGLLDQVFGLIVQFLPFIILPFTFKFAGGIMGNVTGKLQGLATKKGKEAYGKTGFAQGREAKKGYKESLRKEGAQRKMNQKIAGGTGRIGRRADTAERAIAAAKVKQDELRVPAAQEQARKAERSGHSFRQNEEMQRIINDRLAAGDDSKTARAAGLAHLERQALTAVDANGAVDTQARLSAMDLLGQNKGTENLLRVQEASRTGDGSQVWQSALADSSIYGSLSTLSPGLTSGVHDGMTDSDLATARQQALAGKASRDLVGVSKAGWSAALNDPASAATAAQKILDIHNNPELTGDLKQEVKDEFNKVAAALGHPTI